MKIKSGNIRGEVITYPDGIGCCIWIPFEDNDDSGICFDFSYNDIPNIISVLEQIQAIDKSDIEVCIPIKEELNE